MTVLVLVFAVGKTWNGLRASHKVDILVKGHLYFSGVVPASCSKADWSFIQIFNIGRAATRDSELIINRDTIPGEKKIIVQLDSPTATLLRERAAVMGFEGV